MKSFFYLFEGVGLSSEPIIKSILKYGGVNELKDRILGRLANGQLVPMSPNYSWKSGRVADYALDEIDNRIKDLLKTYSPEEINNFFRNQDASKFGNFDISAVSRVNPGANELQQLATSDQAIAGATEFRDRIKERVKTDPIFMPIQVRKNAELVDKNHILLGKNRELEGKVSQAQHDLEDLRRNHELVEKDRDFLSQRVDQLSKRAEASITPKEFEQLRRENHNYMNITRDLDSINKDRLLEIEKQKGIIDDLKKTIDQNATILSQREVDAMHAQNAAKEAQEKYNNLLGRSRALGTLAAVETLGVGTYGGKKVYDYIKNISNNDNDNNVGTA